MTPLDALGAAVGNDGTCERCPTSAGEVRWSGELSLWLCFDCFGATEEPVVSPPTSALSSEIAVPCPSFLVPCPTEAPAAAEDVELGEIERLLVEHAAGKWEAVRVELPPLPGTATPAMHRVARFFGLVLGLRRSVGLPDDVPFAVRWVATHTGMSKVTAGRALRQLSDDGVLTRGDVLPPRGQPRGTQCYRPGDVAECRVDELAGRRRNRALRGGAAGNA